MRQDESIRDLAEHLQETLAFANECSDLRQIKGATDVITEMSRAVLEAASLIDEYVQLPFVGEHRRMTVHATMTYLVICISHLIIAGRTFRSVISADLTRRMQGCQDRLASLNGKFDRTVMVETRMIVREIHNEAITKRKHSTANFAFLHSSEHSL